MGLVYEAEHVVLRKRFALKVLREPYASNETARSRFIREAQAAARIDHPNVVNISHFGDTLGGQAYFVMELLRGRDLGDLLKEETQLPWSRVRPILLQVTSALEAAHAHDIIHRDIKPSNFFLVDTPDSPATDLVKVLDFGIAKILTTDEEKSEELTRTHEMLGTVAYMAPETVQGIPNDPRSDIFSLGATMFRMLVGQNPFQGTTHYAVFRQIVNENPPAPRALQPSIPPEVSDIILKALAKRRVDRFSCMRELREAIRDCPDEASVVSVSANGGASYDRFDPDASKTDIIAEPLPPKTRLVWWLTSIALAMGLFAGAGLLVSMFAEQEQSFDFSRTQRGNSDGRTQAVSIAAPVLDTAAEALEAPAAGGQVQSAGVGEGGAATTGAAVPMDSEEQATPQSRSKPTDPKRPESRKRPHRSTGRARTQGDAGSARRKPVPDSRVINKIRSGIARKCKGSGTVSYHVSGVIKASGRAMSPNVEPLDRKASCISSIVQTATFEPAEKSRPMDDFFVVL